MKSAPVIVVKIGGSLFTTPEFPWRLRDWLTAATDERSDAHFVLVVGGGRLVDAVRKFDRQSPIGNERAHYLCIDLMDVTAGLVAGALPDLPSVDDFDALQYRVRRPGVTLLSPGQFVRHVEPMRRGTQLVADWSVTSDAIAGRLAVVLGAEMLVLLKSVLPSPVQHSGYELDHLADAGYVDGFLPMLAGELPPVLCATLGAHGGLNIGAPAQANGVAWVGFGNAAPSAVRNRRKEMESA